MRITRQEMFTDIIKVLAQRSTCDTKRVGALLAKDNRIISTGYNGPPKGAPHCDQIGCLKDKEGACTRTVHAEANVIAFAARYGISSEGTTLYTTMAPCFTCAKLIINAGIVAVYYIREYRLRDGIEALEENGVLVDRLKR